MKIKLLSTIIGTLAQWDTKKRRRQNYKLQYETLLVWSRILMYYLEHKYNT